MDNNGNANNKKLESALEYSVKLLESGASIEDCLKLYPNQRKELKGLLEVVVSVQQSYPAYPELRPSKLYMKTGKAKFLEAIENGVPVTLEEAVTAPEEKPVVFSITRLFKRAYVTATAAAAAAAILFGSLIFASSNSLPGSPLYTVKRATENVELAMTFDNNAKAKLHYQIAQRRIAEAKVAEEAGEKKTAATIYKDAQQNLTEARKMADASTGSKQKKDNLEGAISSLNEKLKDSATKLAENIGISDDTEKKPAATDTKVALNSDSTDASTQSGVSADTDMDKEDGVVKDVEKPTRNGLVGTDTPVSRRALASIKPFEIDSLNVAGEYISPNSDGAKDKLEITVTGATGSYGVALYKNMTRIATIAEQGSGRDLDFIWNGLDVDGKKVTDGKYSLRVMNRVGQIAHRNAQVTIDTAVEQVSLIEPLDGISTENGNLRFVWSGVEDAATYTLHLRSKVSDDYIVSGLTDNSYQLDRTLMPGDWEWYVVVTDKAGNKSSSATGHFTVKPIEKPVRDSANTAGAETRSVD